MNVIFLDCDGVVCTARSHIALGYPNAVGSSSAANRDEMTRAGTKSYAIETVRFFKQEHPEWNPRLARSRLPDGSWWWYAWTVC